MQSYADDTYTPVERDYKLDLEACMIAIGDLNGYSRILMRGAGESVIRTDSDGVVTRAEVIACLSEVRDMVNRLFRRLGL